MWRRESRWRRSEGSSCRNVNPDDVGHILPVDLKAEFFGDTQAGGVVRRRCPDRLVAAGTDVAAEGSRRRQCSAPGAETRRRSPRRYPRSSGPGRTCRRRRPVRRRQMRPRRSRWSPAPAPRPTSCRSRQSQAPGPQVQPCRRRPGAARRVRRPAARLSAASGGKDDARPHLQVGKCGAQQRRKGLWRIDKALDVGLDIGRRQRAWVAEQGVVAGRLHQHRTRRGPAVDPAAAVAGGDHMRTDQRADPLG